MDSGICRWSFLTRSHAPAWECRRRRSASYATPRLSAGCDANRRFERRDFLQPASVMSLQSATLRPDKAFCATASRESVPWPVSGRRRGSVADGIPTQERRNEGPRSLSISWDVRRGRLSARIRWRTPFSPARLYEISVSDYCLGRTDVVADDSERDQGAFSSFE